MSEAYSEYDLFVSYRWEEPSKTWVRERLVPALEERGVRVCVDYRCFRLGAPLVSEMERAVLMSTVTLSVMTPAYYESGFGDLERKMAQHLDAEEREMRWLAVIREPVDLALLERFRLALDMTDDAEFDAHVDALADAVLNPPEP